MTTKKLALALILLLSSSCESRSFLGSPNPVIWREAKERLLKENPGWGVDVHSCVALGGRHPNFVCAASLWKDLPDGKVERHVLTEVPR